MTGKVKFYPGASGTLSDGMKKDIQRKIESALDKSTVFKKAEVATLGEVYGNQNWNKSRKILVTTMHVARLLKR